MNPYLREGDTQLDHMDLGKYLLRRIIWILLFGVVCGGIAWAFQSHMTKKTAAEAENESTAPAEAEVAFDMDSYEQKIGMIGISNEETRELLRKQQEYLQSAPYMQLDPNHVWRARAIVWLESTSQQYLAYQIEELYRSDLTNTDFLQDLALERGTEVRYLRELIGTWLMSATDSSDSSAGDVVLHEGKKDEWVSSELFCIQALGSTQEEAQALMDVLLEELKELNEKYAEYPHEIKVLSRTCTEAYDAGIRNAQRDQITYTQALLNLWADFEAKSAQVVTPEGAVAAAAAAAAAAEALEPEIIEPEPMNPITAGVIGFVVGVFLACVWFTWRYLKNDKLIDYPDIRRQGMYLKELGTLPEQGAEMAAANIRNYVKEGKKLFLTGMASQAEFDSTYKSLKEYLPEYEIIGVRDVVHDPKSREALIACDAAVLVEQKRVTRYSEMKEEVTFLYNAEKEIAGIVVL